MVEALVAPIVALQPSQWPGQYLAGGAATCVMVLAPSRYESFWKQCANFPENECVVGPFYQSATQTDVFLIKIATFFGCPDKILRLNVGTIFPKEGRNAL